MIQSLKLLQVNTLQLEQLLKTELEMNPVLETNEELEAEGEDAEEKIEEKEERDEDSEVEVGEDQVDWEEYLEEGFGLGESSGGEVDPNKEYFEPTPVHQATLEEHLEQQLAEKKFS